MKTLRFWIVGVVAAFSTLAAQAAGPIVTELTDDVFSLSQRADGVVELRYIWAQPAIVYHLPVRRGIIVYPGRELLTLSIKNENKDLPARSKPQLTSGATYRIEEVNVSVGDRLEPGSTTPLLTLTPTPITHDSTVPTTVSGFSISGLAVNLWRSTGIYDIITQTGKDWTLGLGRLIMMGVGLLLIYLAIFKGFEPLLLIPIGFGAVMTNIPLADLAGPEGVQGLVYKVGVLSGIFPVFIFLGIGAMTDFGPLIANPKTALLGAAAQLGIFAALLGSLLLSFLPGIDFNLKDAASIGIIGGADGPTAIFLATRLSPNLLGAIAVAAYSYMALVPIIQPPIIRLLTTREERLIRMTQLRKVSKIEKVVFPITITLLCAFLLPDAAPLISMLMFGNLLRECGVVERLSDTAQNAMINIVTICLGMAVGSKLSADKFLNVQTLGILLMGLFAFAMSTAGGVIFGKIMCKWSGGKINPMIGAAGVSAVPMSARVVNKIGMQEDPHNFLLMHAMGPNVAGVIGSAVAAGVLLNALQGLGG
jgi:oxaloacetate decarboxylase beta subunit